MRVPSPRLIPARAGKTSPTWTSSPGGPAHPRACGENSRTAPEAAETFGSSPRVRGKPTVPVVRTERTGLIPARAGKTDVERQVLRAHRAHPRACGENITLTILMPVAPGSSPRVRGKLGDPNDWPKPIGLIPARAGKTSSASRSRPRSAAHPRACGENTSGRHGWQYGGGSSPRVRGKHGGPGRGARGRGLIPARAGKTPCPRRRRRPSAAHPRACGENPRISSYTIGRSGSSPRVRGKRYTFMYKH